jgi:hypothetical protein
VRLFRLICESDAIADVLEEGGDWMSAGTLREASRIASAVRRYVLRSVDITYKELNVC